MRLRAPDGSQFGGELTRREMLGVGAAAVVGAAVPLRRMHHSHRTRSPGRRATPASEGWFVPADTVEHERTWMAWPARRDVWGTLLGPVRADIAQIARTIARYEPVSLVARPGQAAQAAAACGGGVTVVPIENDDLWMRDMGPVFLVNAQGDVAGLDLNFNGWGNRQVHPHDATVARRVLEELGLRRFIAPFVSEGGALEIDGEGTAMATESSIINANRNPNRSKARLTQEIREAVGAQEVIWVPGLRNHDITDDHIDSLARFTGAGGVVVDQPADAAATGAWARSEREALGLLERAQDAKGRPLRCTVSRESAVIPRGQNPAEFVNVYVNWYVCNGAVLIPAFGDEASDAAAHSLVSELFPGRAVEQLRIDSVAAGGGGIHCVTQQQPRAS